ncbi:MAG: M56 family metallopeptidase [Planctomycetaceae bacterium]
MTGLTLAAVLTVTVVSPWPSWIHILSSETLPEIPPLIDPKPSDLFTGETSAAAADFDTFASSGEPPEFDSLPQFKGDMLLDGATPLPNDQATMPSNHEADGLSKQTPEIRWQPYAVGVILFALAIGVLRFVIGWIAVRRQVARSCLLTEASLVKRCRNLCIQLGCGRAVELRESDELSTAATVGWRRAIILLPSSWTTWTVDEQQAVLAHELAHVARNHFVSWLIAQTGLVLHFYHPLLHWLASRLRLEQEFEADALAAQITGGSRPYLETLARLALHQDEAPVSWPARAFLPTRRTLLRRIDMLRDSRQTWKPSTITRTIAVMLLLTGAVFAAGVRSPAPVSIEADESSVVSSNDVPVTLNELPVEDSSPANAAVSPPSRRIVQADEPTPQEDENKEEGQPQPNATQQRLVDEIKKLGGSFELAPDTKDWVLQRVDLNNTAATDETLKLIGEEQSLHRLSLATTKITDAGLDHLKNLKNLQTLGLSGTSISDEGLRKLAPLVSLTHIDLTQCNVTGEALVALAHQPLSMLEMNRTQANDRGLLVISRIPPTVSHLFLQKTQVSDKGLSHLGKLTHLRSLVLSETNVTDEGLRHLANLRELRSLYLKGTVIQGPGVEHLKDLPHLASIDLSETQINDAVLKDLMAIPTLVAVQLQETNVTIAGVREFWRVYPRMHISDVDAFPPGDPEEARLLLRGAADDAIRSRQASEANPSESMASKIYQAFKRREEQGKSFHFEWIQTIIDDRGTETMDDDVTCSTQSALAIDGEKVAYAYTGLRRLPAGTTDDDHEDRSKWQMIKVAYQARFDGQTERSLFEYPGSDREPVAFSRPASMCSSVNVRYCLPIVHTFRLLNPAMGNLDWTKVEVSPDAEVIDGHTCILFKTVVHNENSPDFIQQWFVDPSRDFVVLRHVEAQEGKPPAIEADIQYVADAQHGWIPSTWKIRVNMGGQSETVTAEVILNKINPEIPDKEFTIEFPEGVPGVSRNDAAPDESIASTTADSPSSRLTAQTDRPASTGDQEQRPEKPEPDSAQDRLIDEIERLGGSFDVDPDSDDGVVYGINLFNTEATDDTLKLLSDQRGLRWLSLSKTKITDEGLRHLSHLRKLYYLDLSHTNISGQGLEYLKGFPDLESVDLSQTGATDVALKYLMSMPKITDGRNGALSAEGNNFTVASIREFWRAYPRVRFNDMDWSRVGDAEEALLLLRETANELIRERDEEIRKHAETEGHEIFEALRQREERIRSFRFEWKQTIVNHLGTETEEDDIVCSQQSSLAVDGQKVAYAKSGTEPVAKGSSDDLLLGKPQQWETRAMSFQHRFDGLIGRATTSYPDTGIVEPPYLRPAGNCSATEITDTQPIVHNLRALNPAMWNIDWTKVKVSSEATEIDGQACLAIRTLREGVPTSIQTWFVDPSRDFVVVRYTRQREGQPPSSVIDIDFTKDEKHGWLPASWRISILRSGGHTKTVTAQVSKYEINTEIPDEEFTIEFPEGVRAN